MGELAILGITFVVGVIPFVTCFPSWAWADSYSIYGTTIAVDSIATVDASSVKVTIRGESRIIPKSEQNHFIMERLVSDPGMIRRIGTEQLAKIVENALKAEDVKSATLSFVALVEQEGTADSLFEGLVINVARLPKFVAFVAEVVAKLNSRANLGGVVRLLAAAPLEDFGQIAPRGAAFFSENSVPLKSLLHKRYIELISAKSYDAAEKTWVVAKQLFPNDSALSEFAGQRNLVTETLLATRNLDLVRIAELRHNPIFVSAPWLKGVFSDGLHELARQALNKGRFREVLQILSTVDINQITPATHELADEAIAKGVLNGLRAAELLGDIPVALMLRALSQGNPKLARSYSDILDASAREAGAPAVGSLLSELLKIRPDPNPANNELRYSLAINALWRGDRAAAHEMLLASKTPLGVFRKIKLFVLGYFVSPWLLYPGGLLVLFSLGFALLKSRALRIEAQKAEARRIIERTSGFHGSGGIGSEMRLEYLGLLRDFGLPPEASIKEIKAMYRSKVKVHHPDAAGGGDQASDDFLRMNEKYERLLQLHESLAGNGDPEA
jgi:hypothetical protein